MPRRASGTGAVARGNRARVTREAALRGRGRKSGPARGEGEGGATTQLREVGLGAGVQGRADASTRPVCGGEPGRDMRFGQKWAAAVTKEAYVDEWSGLIWA